MNTPVAAPLNLPVDIDGFEATRLIGRGATSLVYYATSPERSVALKILAHPASQSQTTARRLRREAVALIDLRDSGLPTVFSAGDFAGRPYIAIEYMPGGSLEQHLMQRLGVERTLEIALSIAQILAAIHERGYVHRDIKPANILFDDRGRARLVDLDLFTELQLDVTPESFTGTVAYAAPEQTGMLRRPVDARADLYALGVVMYECLAGELPFVAEDPVELMHMHAMAPAPSIRERVPGTLVSLCAIVDRLLAKDPDDRYPSAAALVDALDACVREVGDSWRPNVPRIVISHEEGHSLIGRADEMKALGAALTALKDGSGGSFVVSGSAGSGKSRVAQELMQQARRAGLYTMYGVCTSQPTPFLPLRQALSGGSEARANEDAARDLAALLDLPATAAETDSKERLIAAVTRAITNRAAEHGGAVVVIEDIHWADPATSQVLADLSHVARAARGGKAKDGVLLVVTARASDPTEVGSAAELRGEPLHLAAFKPGHTTRMVSSLLGDVTVAEDMTGRIHELAQGNPLAIEQYVSTVLDTGLLRFSQGGWSLREGKLTDLDLPTSFLDMLASRLAMLDSQTLTLLRAGAVLGTDFDQRLLAAVLPEHRAELVSRLGDATIAGVIHRLDEHTYHFVHEQLVSTLLGQLSAGELRDLHQRAAEALDDGGPVDGAKRYRLARHYAAGAVERNPHRVYETSVAAGFQASAEYADQLALDFFNHALAAADVAHIKPAVDVYARRGVTLYRLDRFEEALSSFDEGLRHAVDPVVRARLYIAKTRVFLHYCDWETARSTLKQGFGGLGVAMPEKGGTGVALSLARWAARGTTQTWVPTVMGAERDRYIALIELYSIASYIAYFHFDDDVMARSAFDQYWYAARVGETTEAVRNYAYFGLVWALVGLQKPSSRALSRALRLAEKIGDPTAVALTMSLHAQSADALGHVSDAARVHGAVYTDHARWLPLVEYRNAVLCYVWHLVVRGRMHEALEVQKALHKRLEAAHALDFEAECYSVLLTALLINKLEAVPQFERLEERYQATISASLILRYQQFSLKMVLLYFIDSDRHSDIARCIAGMESMLENIRTLPTYQQLGLLCAACYRARQVTEGQTSQSYRADFARLAKLVKKVVKAGSYAPIRSIVDGYSALFAGQHDKAIEIALRAGEQGDAFDSPWAIVEAEFLHLAALARSGAPQASILRRATLAHQVAFASGLTSHAQRLRTAYAITSGPMSTMARTSQSAKSTAPAGTKDISGGKQQRQLEALLEVSLASAKVIDPEEQARLAVMEVLRILSAERAFLFLMDEDGRLSVVAGRDASGEPLAELTGFSSTVVQRVVSQRSAIVISGTETGELTSSESMIAHDLRSMIAAPLMMKERLTGVLYLDSRLARGLFTTDDVSILQAICNHIAIALETARIATLEKERAVLEREAQVTAAVQGLLLPQTSLQKWDEFSVGVYFQPAVRASGDWYWYERTEDGRLLLLLGDVTGHGAGAAMVTAVLAGSFRTLMVARPQGDRRDILFLLHDILGRICRGQYAATMSLVDVDPRSRTVTWYNAGGPPLMVLKAGGDCEILTEIGTPLGSPAIQGGVLSVGLRSWTYDDNDRILLFSDGVSEMILPNGRELGYKRVRRQFMETRDLDISASISHLGGMRELMDPDTEADDMTILVLSVGNGASSRV